MWPTPRHVGQTTWSPKKLLEPSTPDLRDDPDDDWLGIRVDSPRLIATLFENSLMSPTPPYVIIIILHQPYIKNNSHILYLHLFFVYFCTWLTISVMQLKIISVSKEIVRITVRRRRVGNCNEWDWTGPSRGGSFPGTATFWGPHRRSEILKRVFQMTSFWLQICIKSTFGWGSAPDPAMEIYEITTLHETHSRMVRAR